VTGAGGSDWVSASAAAATSATIAAAPGGTGARNLVVTNTSDRRTTVSVDVLSASSTFAAAGAEAVAIEAASTVTIPLDAALRGDVSGLRITATQPVVAALWSTSAEGDLAVSPARPAFQGRSVVPLIPGSVLVASNPGTAAATLTVILRNESSMVETQTLTVNPGTTLQVPLTTGTAVELNTDSADLRLSTLVTTLNGVTGIGVAAWGPGGPGEAEVSPTIDPNLA
jgi:P pilus assembly chaperone PapD